MVCKVVKSDGLRQVWGTFQLVRKKDQFGQVWKTSMNQTTLECFKWLFSVRQAYTCTSSKKNSNKIFIQPELFFFYSSECICLFSISCPYTSHLGIPTEPIHPNVENKSVHLFQTPLDVSCPIHYTHKHIRCCVDSCTIHPHCLCNSLFLITCSYRCVLL